MHGRAVAIFVDTINLHLIATLSVSLENRICIQIDAYIHSIYLFILVVMKKSTLKAPKAKILDFSSSILKFKVYHYKHSIMNVYVYVCAHKLYNCITVITM